MPDIAQRMLPRRRLFRFTLRALMLFTAIVGLLLGVVVKERRQSSCEQELVAELKKSWVSVEVSPTWNSYEFDDAGEWQERFQRWRGSILGERIVLLFGCHDTTQDEFRLLANLSRLQSVECHSHIIDSLEPLADLTELIRVVAHNGDYSDLEPLRRLTKLKELDVYGTSVTDLRPLAHLTQLQKLNISGTPVKDLTPLAGLRNLRFLNVLQTDVTIEQVDSLRKALPKCNIRFEARATSIVPPGPPDSEGGPGEKSDQPLEEDPFAVSP